MSGDSRGEQRRPRSRTRLFRFGPGYLESIALRVWTKPSRSALDGSKFYGARIEGSVDLCDGNGYLERVPVYAEDAAWSNEPHDHARLIATVRQAADLDKAEALAHRLVEYALADTGR